MTNIEKLESNFLEANKINRYQIEEKTFYSSELSEELLVNYLSRISNSDNTQAFNNFDLSILFRDAASVDMNTIDLSHELNGWTIKGMVKYYDRDTKTICLPVVLSTNRILEISSQGRENKYAIDLAVAKYLARKQTTNDINLAVIAIDRLFTNYKAMPTKLINFIPIENIYSDAEIEQMLIQRTTDIDKHLKSKKPPGICSNLRWHKRQGKSINMSCTHYCAYNHVCTHAKKNSKARISKNSIIF